MAVSKRLRYEVLRRDNYRCRYCGGAAPDVKLTVDHVLAVTLGGTDAATNLVTACADCNGGKSATPPDAALVEDVSQDQVRWGRAMALAIEQRTAELTAERTRVAQFDLAWTSWSDPDGNDIPRDGGWKSSVARFMAAGLDDEFLADAVATAIGNQKIRNRDAWRYFCGICWREIEKLQKAAAALVEPASPADGHLALGDTPDESFDYMTMFDVFLEDLVPALGGDTEVVKFVSWDLWNAMPDAHKVWRETLRNPGELDEDETSVDAAIDASREQMEMSIANGMYKVRLWRESRDRFVAGGGLSDGS